MATLDQIETIVVLMLENRSFDHLLGYLRLPQFGAVPLDGIQDSTQWRQQYANPGPPNNFMYEPIEQQDLHTPDPPHERPNVATQLGHPDNGVYPMKGFIASANGDSEVMHYYTRKVVPINDFFARNFAVCDRWFAPLPAGTQPNRLMAMSGYTDIDMNVATPLTFPDQPLAYDWLKQRGIRWRVYHQGFFPFFAMMPRWAAETVVSDQFRRYERLAIDFELEPDQTFPQVIFVEPKYTDSPHVGEGTDDHPPSSVLGGQHLLLSTYKALVSNPLRWRKTVMIATYDEHGGFFDHVQPLPLVTQAPNGRYPEFTSSGVRVPAMIISPLVSPGRVFSQNLDHLSILKLIGEKFGAGNYSPEVDNRKVHSVLETLDLNSARQPIPLAPLDSIIPMATPLVRGVRPLTENVSIFQQVADKLIRERPHELATKFPEHRDFLGI